MSLVADVEAWAAQVTGRTNSSGSDLMYRPLPHSCSTVQLTDARQPSSHRTQPSIQPSTQAPSCQTSTRRGSSKRRTRGDSVTDPTVGDGIVDEVAVERACRGDLLVSLTAAEAQEAFRLLSRDRSASEIAGLLGVSQRTVSRWRAGKGRPAWRRDGVWRRIPADRGEVAS